MNTRRIVIFAPFIRAFGGVERQIVDLSRFLHNENLPHSIVCLECTVDLAKQVQWPVDLRVLGAPRNLLAEVCKITRYFNDKSNDDIQTPLFFDLKGAFYAGLLNNRKYHLHLTDPPSLLPEDVSKHAPSIRSHFVARDDQSVDPAAALRGEIVHRINRRGVRRASVLFSTTRAIAGELKTLYAKEAIVVNPGVQPPPAALPPREGWEVPMHLLSVCRLEANKRIDWILHALAKIEALDGRLKGKWALDVVGEGSEADALRNLANSLGIADRVLFHGRVSDADLDVLFSNSSAFVMPAVQGYGLPALEALIRGVPVVMHRQSGASEILADAPWVELVEEGPDDLACAIDRMAANIQSGALSGRSPPAVPTASQWARKITAACGWC